MNAEKTVSGDIVPEPAPEKEGFSLVVGGPLYTILVRTGLVQPPIGLFHRPILVCVLVTWLPLAVFTAQDGTFAGGVNVPFLYDLGNVRFLVVLPILLGAELIVHRRMRGIVGQFLERGLIAPEDRLRFDGMISSTVGLRNSVVSELLLLLISLTGGYWVWRTYGTLQVATWYGVPLDGSIEFTRAGYWFAFVSLPITRFIIMRWYFRLCIWYLFLWRVSRLSLKLNPLHPDRAGGLGFLANTVYALGLLLIAQSAFLASMIANQIVHEGKTLPEFKLELAAFVVFLMLLVIFPLLFFARQMVEVKLAASREFGILASRYANEFRQKWLEGGAPPEEAFLGSADIQSLADLGNSFEVVRSMRSVPFDRGLIVHLAILIALPMLPLALTMFSVEEMVERLLKLLM